MKHFGQIRGISRPWALLHVLGNLSFVLLVSAPLCAQVRTRITEPHILSVFPSGAKPGAKIQAEIHGVHVAGAYAIWFEDGGLTGRIQSVEETKEVYPEKKSSADKKTKSQPVYRIVTELDIPAAAAERVYLLRLVTPRGVSTKIAFRVVNGPASVETSSAHSVAKDAQAINPPTTVFGRLVEAGELDYYSFRASRGQELSVEVTGGEGLDPRVGVFRQGGSWFDADRPTRILTEEERSSDLMRDEARGTVRVPEDGEYFIEVSSLFGKESPDSSYQLRVAPKEAFGKPTAAAWPSSEEWTERSFARKLEVNWIKAVATRGVDLVDAQPASGVEAASEATGAGDAAVQVPAVSPKIDSSPQLFPDQEPNDLAAQAPLVMLPAIIEGTTGRPGDIDSFRFKVEAGQKIAIEIETPDVKPPYYNPRLGVVDSQDHELFSNVDRTLSLFNNNADPQIYLKAISPKTTYTFERAGEYVLQLRDITSRYGNPGYRYRMLVRPEVPHIGEVSIERLDQLNLKRGEPRRLAINAEFEEGFTGDVSFAFEDLPAGVEVHPAVQYSDARAPLDIPQNPEVVSARTLKTAIVLLAGPEAALTREPVVAKMTCRPIAQGKLGPRLLVREIPVMIVDKPAQKAEGPK